MPDRRANGTPGEGKLIGEAGMKGILGRWSIRAGAFVPIVGAMLLGIVACRSDKEPAPEQLAEDVRKEIAAIQSEKSVVDQKIRDIERSRAFLEARSREELDSIRRSIESIQNALTKIQQRLDKLQGTERPTEPVAPKRLPIGVSIALLAIIIACAAIYLKLRSIRSREQRRSEVEPKPEEAAGESPTQPSEKS